MRKGTILIFLGENETRHNCAEFLKEKLGINGVAFDCETVVNGYHIHILKNHNPNCCRGFRAEICYINNTIDIDSKKNSNDLNWLDIELKTKMYSNRKEPVRFISSFKDIDLRELIDDKYSLDTTIDKSKIDEWNKRLSILNNSNN